MSTDQRPTPFYLSPSTISLHRAAFSKGNVTRRVDKEIRASLPDFAVVAQVFTRRTHSFPTNLLLLWVVFLKATQVSHDRRALR